MLHGFFFFYTLDLKFDDDTDGEKYNVMSAKRIELLAFFFFFTSYYLRATSRLELSGTFSHSSWFYFSIVIIYVSYIALTGFDFGYTDRLGTLVVFLEPRSV